MTSTVTRNHKDNVFCLLFRDKKNLLSLYNAMNGTNYTKEEELEVVTLEYGICIRMKNDAAFVIDTKLNLYEQQATVNPNVPIRLLYYVAEEYKKLVPMSKLYRSTPVKIPMPKFVVFYNGKTKQPEERIFRLSDLYERREGENGEPELQLTVRQMNINAGYNEEVKEKCESLRGYMIFVEKVREKTETGILVEQAVAEAVEECIREGILADFFRENKGDVIAMAAYEYEFNEELYEKELREEGWEQGHAAGKTEGKTEYILDLLEELGTVPEELRQRILKEQDAEVLRKWHRFSARVTSIEEFQKNILQA